MSLEVKPMANVVKKRLIDPVKQLKGVMRVMRVHEYWI